MYDFKDGHKKPKKILSPVDFRTDWDKLENLISLNLSTSKSINAFQQFKTSSHSRIYTCTIKETFKLKQEIKKRRHIVCKQTDSQEYQVVVLKNEVIVVRREFMKKQKDDYEH